MPPLISDLHNNGRPGRPIRIGARANREYVAAGTLYPWAASYYQSLPDYIDDLGQILGADIYERMLNDAQVAACIHTLKVGTLAQEISLLPPVEEQDPQHARAVEIAAFCERNLARVDGFRTKILYNMLDAFALGHKIAEIVYEPAEGGEDAGKLMLKALKVKPRKSYAFVVDVYMNVVGVLGLIPDRAPWMPTGVILDPKQQPNLLPRSKFALLSMREVDADPRGASFLRPAYDPWWQKIQVKPEGLKHITQFGGGSIWATTPTGAQEVPERDEEGNVVMDADGNISYISPETQLMTELMRWQNGRAAAFPDGTEVHIEKPAGEWGAFKAFFDWQNREITVAILLQELATREGRYQTRAASQTHQDILGLVLHHCRNITEEMIRGDLLARLVEYNYGAEALPLVPNVSLGDVQEEDRIAMWTAAASLMKAGYIADSQFRHLDAMIGLPPRDEEEIAANREQREMQQQLLRRASDGDENEHDEEDEQDKEAEGND